MIYKNSSLPNQMELEMERFMILTPQIATTKVEAALGIAGRKD